MSGTSHSLEHAVAGMLVLSLAVACSDGETEQPATGSDDTAVADGQTDSLPDCRSELPVTGDWCLLVGDLADGGAVYISGPLGELIVQPPAGSYSLRVPLGLQNEATITVNELDADLTSVAREELVVTRERAATEPSSESRGTAVRGIVRSASSSIPVAGAEVTHAGYTVTTDELGNFSIPGSVGADLIHVHADGHIGRVDSIEALTAFDEEAAAEAQVRGYVSVELRLQPLDDPIAVERGAASVELSDGVRLVFGPDGAPNESTVSLTAHPELGNALQGVSPQFDISPIRLGPGGSVRFALSDEFVEHFPQSPGALLLDLWDPATATRRPIVAHIDFETGEAIAYLEAIRGESAQVGPLRYEIERSGASFSDTIQIELGYLDRCNSDAIGFATHAPEVTYDRVVGVSPSVLPVVGPAGVQAAANLAGLRRQVLEVRSQLEPGTSLARPYWVNRRFTEVTVTVWLNISPDPDRDFNNPAYDTIRVATYRYKEMTHAELTNRAGNGPPVTVRGQTDDQRCGNLAGTWSAVSGPGPLLFAEGRGNNALVVEIEEAGSEEEEGSDTYSLTALFGCGHRNEIGLRPLRDDRYEETVERSVLQNQRCGYIGDPSPGGAGCDVLDSNVWSLDRTNDQLTSVRLESGCRLVQTVWLRISS